MIFFSIIKSVHNIQFNKILWTFHTAPSSFKLSKAGYRNQTLFLRRKHSLWKEFRTWKGCFILNVEPLQNQGSLSSMIVWKIGTLKTICFYFKNVLFSTFYRIFHVKWIISACSKVLRAFCLLFCFWQRWKHVETSPLKQLSGTFCEHVFWCALVLFDWILAIYEKKTCVLWTYF